MQNKFKKFIGPLVLLGFIASILACASSHKTRTVVEKPGWYGVSTPWNNGRNDIDGQVGYSLYVSTPGGKCLPSNSWSAYASIVSGTLPSGVTLNSAPFSITGTPTERGHWIVKLKLSSIQCGGTYYKDFEQELRFHITGSGKVNN